VKPMRELVSWSVFAVLAPAVTWSAPPGPPAGADATVRSLLVEALPDVPGKELEMMTVEYPPGGSSKPHRHNAYVLVYVLEGTLAMQVAGQPQVLLHRGDTFIERPADVHVVSRNVSQTRAARFLAVFLKPVDAPVSPSARGAHGSSGQ
jgi:quercetin dioxygenase-like cupin family protein